MAEKIITGYSQAQIALHWLVVVAVAFQYVANSGIVAAWNALLDGKVPSASDKVLAWLHIASGSLVLLLALARIYLRATRGIPHPPSDEPRILKISAEAVHVSIYAFLLILPITGLAAWYFGIALAGTLHSWLTKLLLGAIALHIAGALFQHFVRRSDVLMRMFRPQRR